MLMDLSKLLAFDADYISKKELQVLKNTETLFARYVFFGERLWEMYDDGVEIIRKMVDDTNSITNAEKEKYLNISLDNRLYRVDFDGEIKYINAFVYNEFAQTAIYLREFLNNNIEVSYCKNCGKPFISNGKSIYCHRFDNSEQRLCRTIGALNTYQKNLDDNPAMAGYRKAYKRYIARRNAGKITESEFKEWQIKAKSAIADYDDGHISWDKFLTIVNVWE